MKLAALALDYDGTIAIDGVLDPSMRDAIAFARQQHLTILLVTGRRIDDLRHVAGDLSCFDVVVAENGAVLEFPSSGRHVLLAHAASKLFVDELRRRGIACTTGEVVIEAEAGAAAAALGAVRQLEQPLILAFNRSRLMILP